MNEARLTYQTLRLPLAAHISAAKRAVAFTLTVLTMLTPTSTSAQSYDTLWRRVRQHEQQGKPQSAYSVVETIHRKATADGNEGQRLSALVRGISLHQEWAPDSFFADVPRMEAERQQQTSAEARAIYASVLAEVYQGNRHRSQAAGLALTSTDMREWTREQYDSAALACWQASLDDIPTLAKASTKKWLPMVAQGKTSAYFNHDLLHFLWQRAVGQRLDSWDNSRSQLLSLGIKVADEYARNGNRDAQLLVWLDLVDALPTLAPDSLSLHLSVPLPTTSYASDAATRSLLALKDAFADRPLSVEVYQRLTARDLPDSVRVALAQEAISRHPRYERINQMHNVLTSLRQPQVTLTGSSVYYPSKDYLLPIAFRNATTLTVKVYQLADTFTEDDMYKSNLRPSDYVARHGRLVQTLRRELHHSDVYATLTDSLPWTAPEVGRYAFVPTAVTTEQQAVSKSVSGDVRIATVSRLQPLLRTLSDGSVDAIVADALTGHPVADVEATLFLIDYTQPQPQRLAVAHSDANGHLLFPPRAVAQRQRYSVAFALGADRWLPRSDVWSSYWHPSNDHSASLRLYTDRSIYRPGQTVRLSGIAYEQDHWQAHVAEGQPIELTLRDANGKEVARQSVTTDSMGVIEAAFTLPAGGITGVYQVVSRQASISFRVEEYKRPTFEVTMDEAPALQWPQDSITLTGRAMGYNGVPIRSARVTATFQYTFPYRWLSLRNDSPVTEADTVATDADGRFSLRLPLSSLTDEVMAGGLVMRVNVAVLAPSGETRETLQGVPLCSAPLRLSISMESLQDRARTSAPRFTLLSSTAQPVDGTIDWHITADTLTNHATPAAIVASGKLETSNNEASDIWTRVLQSLPTGSYTLRAVATVGIDTASAEARFCTFALDDTQLPRHTPLWLYCPADTFSTAHPATLQVGTSYPDAVIYYSIVAPDGSHADSLLHLSNELHTLTIPYTDSYGDGVTVSFALIHDGQVEAATQALRHPLPQTELQWEWLSFRDKLHPGDEETWTLRISRPDGTPASANMMATIYDASLEQLVPHAWQLLVSRYHRLRWLTWNHHDLYRLGTAQSYLTFTTKTRNVPSLAFDAIAPEWTTGLSFVGYNHVWLTSAAPRRMYSRAAGMVATEEVMADDMQVYEAASAAMPMTALAKATDEEAEVDDDGAAPDTPTATPAPAYVRSDFRETAAFLPRLHTDPATGTVSLTFTLPESVTTWRMLGLAHTQDMFTAAITAEAITHRELMAQLHLPRFLRAGDEGTIRATIQNQTEQPLAGKARLELIDPTTERIIKQQAADFATDANGETSLRFAFTPQADVPIVVVRLTAESTLGKGRKQVRYSDGEQRYLAILPAEEWVTESVEIAADSLGTFTTDLTSLFNHNHPSATQRRLTIDYTTHPIWNVVQALPALRDADRDDVLSLTAALYANALAAHTVSTMPRLRDVITLWQQQANAAQANVAVSPLAADEELTQMVIDETPWLREATTDSERRAQLIDLLDSSLVAMRLQRSLDLLAERQHADGGFAWFPSMPSSTYMTSMVALHLSRLARLTDHYSTLPPALARRFDTILQRAFAYVSTDMHRTVEQLRCHEAKGEKVTTAQTPYLYYIYTAQVSGLNLTREQQTDITYLLNHLQGTVAQMGNSERALATIVLNGAQRHAEASAYYTSMMEHLTTTSDHGAFFDYPSGSFTPTDTKIARHTLAMEAVAAHEANAPCAKGLRRWLLQQKRTQMWETRETTIDAIYALLSTSPTALQATATDRLTLNYGRRHVEVTTTPKPRRRSDADATQLAALGHLRATYTDAAAPTSITVVRQSEGEAWGAVYAQYLTPLATATSHAEGLTVRQQLSATTAKVGDRLTTRYVLTADRDYDYVCLRAPRPACAEPAEARSGYRYQGGLGYYLSVRDAHTDYFFEHLPKGTYILEETAYVEREGSYATGLVTLRCVYAPEYGANTESTTVVVE